MRSHLSISRKPSPLAKPLPLTMEGPWTIDDAAELYRVKAWGKGFFDINDKGHVVVRPQRDAARQIDLYDIVSGLAERGINTPVLLSFSDLLEKRIRDFHEAFAKAIRDNDYKGRYSAVYPIKVNQQRHLVELVQHTCSELGFGLEVGSKPELLAVLGMTASNPDQLIICNGYKEEAYIRYTMLATKLGRTIIPVIESINELNLIIKLAKQHDVRPRIGVRVNLNARGVGRWRHSTGEKAKFGLNIPQVLNVVKLLREHDMIDCLKLVHCHLGSQIHDIRNITAGVSELTRVYVELAKMGAGVEYLDIGGGMGVDYDGSQTNFEYSTNYSLEEYAANAIYRIMSICDDEGVKHPTVITECGRAMVSYNSVLIFNVVGANRVDGSPLTPEQTPDPKDKEIPRPILDLLEAATRLNEQNIPEVYHDILDARDEATNLFNLGHLSLEHRGLADRLYWITTTRIRDICRTLDEVPEELQDIETALSDTYFCNMSIFQSLPDTWAIDQIFPIMPIHKLDEQPTRHATLADLTCDSDGKIDRFVDRDDVKPTIMLHEINHGDEYFIGTFLVGAYQETLGDLHNLFGDTHVVHISLDESGDWCIDNVVEGDTVREVLQYTQYDVHRLFQAFRLECERSVRAGRLPVAESHALLKAYEAGLSGYTYLE